MVHNVHERLLPVPVDEVGPLLDRIGGPDDVLWPAPAWAPMVLDRPVAPGAVGGHGGIRYRVTAHQPQRSITFTFEPGQGLNGTHTLSVRPAGPSSSVLRHEAEGWLTGWMRALWPLAVRPAHDAVLEDMFDRAEAVLGVGPARPARWSPWVRMLRRWEVPRARETTMPETPLLAASLPRVDFADAHAVEVFRGTPADPQVWADAMFRHPPRWMVPVLGWRAFAERVVARGGHASLEVRRRTDDELLLGADEDHGAVRISVLREADRVVMSTVVQLHNRRGRAYFALVRRLHPVVARGVLTAAARRLSGSSNPAAPEPTMVAVGR
jgi:Protein of unknown function (DUF2867)